MNWLRRVMYGRNGPDQLSLALLILGLALMILSMLIPVPALQLLFQLLDYTCMVLFFYRTLSRNLYKRHAENARYLAAVRKVKNWFRLRGRMIRESREYRYLKCPNCRQWLRVPKGKGKIRVSCSKCGERFERKV